MLVANVVTIPVAAPLFVIGPCLASGYQLTHWFWISTLAAVACGYGFMVFGIAREVMRTKDAESAGRREGRNQHRKQVLDLLDRTEPAAGD